MTHVSVGEPYLDKRIPDFRNRLVWKDDLSVGPVQRTDTLPELSGVRDAFWNVPSALRKASSSSSGRDQRFAELSGEVVVWCGENRREVLMLAAVLRFLKAGLPVSIVACGGIRGTAGYGPDDFVAAYERRHALSDEMRRDLLRLWEAYASSDPQMLNEIAASGDSLTARIATRILAEYPSAATGLSQIEETLLAKVADGTPAVWAVAETLGAVEEPVGDLTLFDLLWNLVHCDPPVLEIAEAAPEFRSAKLRKTGRTAILPRWIGGVKVDGRDFPWRYDPERRQVFNVS